MIDRRPWLDRYRIIDDGPHWLTVEQINRVLRWRPREEQSASIVAPCDDNSSHRHSPDKA